MVPTSVPIFTPEQPHSTPSENPVTPARLFSDAWEPVGLTPPPLQKPMAPMPVGPPCQRYDEPIKEYSAATGVELVPMPYALLKPKVEDDNEAGYADIPVPNALLRPVPDDDDNDETSSTSLRNAT